MPIARRECVHHYFLAECGKCGFALEGEIRNGFGGWKTCDWNAFSRTCAHRTSAGRPTMICPHLHAAKLGAQPLTIEDFQRRLGPSRSADAPGELDASP